MCRSSFTLYGALETEDVKESCPYVLSTDTNPQGNDIEPTADIVNQDVFEIQQSVHSNQTSVGE